MKVTDLDINENIINGLKKMGYENLTPVQAQTLPHILAGKDLLARAETGSGKTSACAIPMVQRTDSELQAIQGLILVPTRELALQYVAEIADVARQTQIKPFAVYGGLSSRIQNAKLEHGVHILVATPGRLIDLLYNTPLSLSDVNTFVLDEADEMLKMGFIDDVEFIISCLVHEHQTLMFSATMPGPIKKLSRHHLKDPIIIELNKEQVAPQELQHHFLHTYSKKRFDKLIDYLEKNKPAQAIIFCNSRRNVIQLHDKLKKRFDSVDSIHGGLEQAKRTSLFNKFKRRNIRYMIATDIASRGLDFQHVSHVINYDFPLGLEAYTHRTGRTARMGRKGIALTLYTDRDKRTLKQLLRINRIEPVWIGEKPQLDKLSSGRSQSSVKKTHRSGKRTRSRSRRTRKSEKPATSDL